MNIFKTKPDLMNLQMKVHFEYPVAKKKVYKNIYNSVFSLCSSLVWPHLESTSIWNPYYKVHIDKLDSFQRKF